MPGTTLKGTGSISVVSHGVRSAVLSGGISCDLVGSNIDKINDVEVHTLVFEKYFMRASNRVSLTVVLVAHGESISATIIGSGGGQGPIFSFSWGAEGDFAADAERALRQYGFR